MKNYILPAILILVGAGSAFATQNTKGSKESLAIRQGYIFNSSTNQWDRSVLCNDDSGPICTVDGELEGERVYGTNGPEVDHPVTADVTLFKN
jgi:hypothetical protein